MPVVKFMKSKLAEGKWNIHRMVREVSTVQAWNQAKDKIVERSKVEPIIGVCYMVGEKLNKAALGSIIDDCMQSVKPCHAQIICTPCYDFDWSTADNNKKTAWTTTANSAPTWRWTSTSTSSTSADPPTTAPTAAKTTSGS